MEDQNPTQTTWFVTRHDGAKRWAAEEGFRIDKVVEHLKVDAVKSGDIVIGSLPFDIVARLNEKGVRYFHIILPLPRELRGQPISAKKMHELGASVEEFIVIRRGKLE